MTNHQQTPIMLISPELSTSMEMVANQANELINWLAELLPELERPQVGYLAATLLSLYLEHLKTDPEMIDSIKTTAENIKNVDYGKQAN